MKNLFYIMLLGLLSNTVMTAQMFDSNTEVINNYFQITQNQEAPLYTASTKIELNKESYVNIVQTGIDNNININSLQTGDEQVVSQTGEKNNYEYYNYYSRENSSMQVNQEGTLNSLQVFGENSLMKDATINQKSDFKSIVIKNYTK